MEAKLEVIRGAKPVALTLRLPTIIGRGSDSKIKLAASTVSRNHCELYEYEGQLVVRDLGSSNGTFVNGHKINAATFLTAEDELEVGPVWFRWARASARLSSIWNPRRLSREVSSSVIDRPSR